MLVRYGTSPTPGMSGTSARPPTLMKMRGAVSSSSPTRTRIPALEPGVPSKTVQPSMLRSHLSTPVRELADDRVGARLDAAPCRSETAPSSTMP